MGGRPKIPDEEFAAIWQRCQGHTPTIAKLSGVSVRTVMYQRKRVEERLGIMLVANDDRTQRGRVSLPKIGARRLAKVKGTVIVFSDAHFWPEEPRSPAFIALVELCRQLNPVLVVNNGDAFDGARISRHPPTDWARLPDVADELEACKHRLAEIEEVIQKDVPLIWNAGNHDSRFSIRLAQVASEFSAVHGMDLKDHFPRWDFGWSLLINEKVMVKHRYAGGVHATYNNTLRSGLSMVTGHLHRLCVTPWSDYNGTRWGVDTGTLSSFGPEVQKFAYSEDNPMNWAQGFAVLTFDDHGHLLPPELVQVIDGKAYFRGAPVNASAHGMKVATRSGRGSSR
jgi:hypothetical protein